MDLSVPSWAATRARAAERNDDKAIRVFRQAYPRDTAGAEIFVLQAKRAEVFSLTISCVIV